MTSKSHQKNKTKKKKNKTKKKSKEKQNKNKNKNKKTKRQKKKKKKKGNSILRILAVKRPILRSFAKNPRILLIEKGSDYCNIHRKFHVHSSNIFGIRIKYIYRQTTSIYP